MLIRFERGSTVRMIRDNVQFAFPSTPPLAPLQIIPRHFPQQQQQLHVRGTLEAIGQLSSSLNSA